MTVQLNVLKTSILLGILAMTLSALDASASAAGAAAALGYSASPGLPYGPVPRPPVRIYKVLPKKQRGHR